MKPNLLTLPSVLALDRRGRAIDVHTPQQAFLQMVSNVAAALEFAEATVVPWRWADWINLPVREHDRGVETPHGLIRIPTVILLTGAAGSPRNPAAWLSLRGWQRRSNARAAARRNPKLERDSRQTKKSRSPRGPSWETCLLPPEPESRSLTGLSRERGFHVPRAQRGNQEQPTAHFIREFQRHPCGGRFRFE